MSRRNQRRDQRRRAGKVLRWMRIGLGLCYRGSRETGKATESWLHRPGSWDERPLRWRGRCAIRAHAAGCSLFYRSEVWCNPFGLCGQLGQLGSPQPYP